VDAEDLSGGATGDTSEHEDRLATIPDLTPSDPLAARLKDAYRKALASVPTSQRGLLREAQHAWIRYRDTTCSFMTQLGDRGTSALLADDSCHLLATAERVRWLESIPLD
jgi:uncharacterized protein YecT (DUF1311 family)